jgi:hypothetical protein
MRYHPTATKDVHMHTALTLLVIENEPTVGTLKAHVAPHVLLAVSADEVCVELHLVFKQLLTHVTLPSRVFWLTRLTG